MKIPGIPWELSLQKRSQLSNPPEWLVHWVGGGMSTTSAGMIINEHTAMQISAVHACVQVISDDVAALPWVLMEMDLADARVRRRAVNQPLHRLLHDRPNDEMTSFEFRQNLMKDVLLLGNGLAEIERNGAGRPVALWPLETRKTRLDRNLKTGALFYWTEHRITKQQVALSFRDVFHVKGMGNGLWGISILENARRAFGLAAAREEYGARFFGNSARPDIVLMPKGHMHKDARDKVLESWNKILQGPEQAHKAAMLPYGFDIEKLSLSPQDVQFLELGQFAAEDVARWFRVKPNKIQILKDSSVRANIEESNIEHITDTLMSWIIRLEQAANWKLLADQERGRFFTKLVVEGKLRGNYEMRTKGYQSGILTGWMTPNEARELEDRNPFTGGDIHLIPLNAQPISALSGQPTRPPKGSGEGNGQANGARAQTFVSPKIAMALVASHRALLIDTAQRIFKKEANAVTRAARKLLQGGTIKDFRIWAHDFYRSTDHAGFVTRAIAPALNALASAVHQAIGSEHDQQLDPALLERELADYCAEAGRQWSDRSHQDFEIGADYSDNPPTLAAEIESQITDWQRQRSLDFADRRGAAVAEIAIRTAYQQMGFSIPAQTEHNQTSLPDGQAEGAIP